MDTLKQQLVYGGSTTPTVARKSVPQKAQTVSPLKTPSSQNQSTLAYQKAMSSAIKNTKTFGMPGK